VFAHNFAKPILMVALCIPRNSELVPTAFVGLDSLLASSTSIIQAFPTSYLYRVSPSISSFGRWTGYQTNFGPPTPISFLPRRGEELVGIELPCSVRCLAGTRGRGKRRQNPTRKGEEGECLNQ
jgi:hypothetical protein